MSENRMSVPCRLKWIREHFAEGKLDDYGKTYLSALAKSYDQYGDSGLRTQVLYIIGNAWFPKGSQARKELLAYANGS
jgi:hypothetical protein